MLFKITMANVKQMINKNKKIKKMNQKRKMCWLTGLSLFGTAEQESKITKTFFGNIDVPTYFTPRSKHGQGTRIIASVIQ